MAEGFLGSVVSLDCGESLGTYQGLITKVDSGSQTITITKPFRNGVQCKVPNVTLSASDIQDLKLLKSKTEASSLPEVKQNVHASPTPCSEHKEAKPAPTAAARLSPSQVVQNRASPKNGYHKNQTQSSNVRGSPTKNMRHANGHSHQNGIYDENGAYPRRRANSASEQYVTVQSSNGRKFSTPQKNGGNKQQQQGLTNGCSRKQYQQGDTFNTPVDTFTGEFDFEKNLAMFDKQAVFQEIENSGMAEIMKVAAEKKQAAKYGCHENVLQSGPVQYRQIKVEGNSEKREFVTDSGLVVPCVSYDLRSRLLEAAETAGFSRGRQMEMIGRSATEMVLQLCGGSHRLNPRNAHQRPVVVLLVGPHIQGAQAANTARQLASHNVHVTVYKPNYLKVLPELEEELKLLSFSQAKITSSTKDLPSVPVDLIVSAIDSHTQSNLSSLNWYCEISQWANSSKAPVLKLDPPTTSASNSISAKWLLGVALPLSTSANDTQVYLCDLGIPKQVFKKVGIKYVSPFEHKFVIPLHPTSQADKSRPTK